MAAESATTETVEKKESGEDNSVKLKENGEPTEPPKSPESTPAPAEDDEPAPAKKRGVQGEKEEQDEQESASPEDAEDNSTQQDEKDNLDDDQNVENPAYIPKTGRFYMHDDNRRGDVEDLDGDDSRRGSKKSRADGDWKHDRFDEKFQRPKTKKQIVTKYGFDIRHKEGETTEDKDTTTVGTDEEEVSRKERKKTLPKGEKRRPMKQREREDTVDEEEKEEQEGDGDEEARPAQKRHVKMEKEKRPVKPKSSIPPPPPPRRHSSDEVEEDDEEEDDSNIRRGQRRVVPLRRGPSGAPPSRLRGRMSHPLGPPRRGTTPTFQDKRTTTVTRRDYSNHDNRHDDRFENHRRGVIRGASRGGGVASGSGRGFTRGAPRATGGPRFQTRRTDTSEQSEGYQRGGSGTDYSSPRPPAHQPSPPVVPRGNSAPHSYPSSSYRGGNSGPYNSRGNYQNGGGGGDYHHHHHHQPRGFHSGPPKRFGGPPPPMNDPRMVPVGVVPPPQMTRGTTHQAGQQRIRQPTDVVYFDPQQQQGNRQLPQRSKKVIPIVDPKDQQ